MVDGSAHNVPVGHDTFWRNLITPAGGEVLQWPPDAQPVPQRVRAATSGGRLLPTPTASVSPVQVTVTAGPTPPIPPELEARLRAIEAKLDRVLRKLEAAERAPAPK